MTRLFFQVIEKKMADLVRFFNRDADMVFVVPRGVDRNTVREMILEALGDGEDLLVVTDDEIEAAHQITLGEEPTLKVMRANMLIDSNTPYFPAYNFDGTRNIFLLSYGVETRVTNGIDNLYQQAEWVAVEGGNRVRMEAVVVEMSPRQAANYREVRKKERISLGLTPSPDNTRRRASTSPIAEHSCGAKVPIPKPPTQKESYEAKISLRSLQAGNFVYPEEQQVELSKPREKRKPLPLDALKKSGGWITKADRTLLSEYSPKYEALLNHIDTESKTIIWTRFKERYGALGLEDWIKMDYPDLKVQVVTGDIKPAGRKKFYDAFSEEEAGVLITTVIPTDEITGVSHLYILEGTEQHVVQQLLDNIKGGTNGLTVTFFISNRSRDRSFYAPFEKMNKEKMSAFDEVLARCQYSLSMDGEITERK